MFLPNEFFGVNKEIIVFWRQTQVVGASNNILASNNLLAQVLVDGKFQKQSTEQQKYNANWPVGVVILPFGVLNLPIGVL